MRKLWFKQEMKEAILSGRKTTTTRDHAKSLGRLEAWCGSWRNPEEGKKFAVLEITEITQTVWSAVVQFHWEEEGFNSPEHMAKWIRAQGLFTGAEAPVYFHRFRVVEKVQEVLAA